LIDSRTIRSTPGLWARTANKESNMQLSPLTSGARYGGYLSIMLPTAHPAWSPGYEGEYQVDPRFVVTSAAIRKNFDNLADAVAAAQRVSAGARDAVAVVRDPGTKGPYHVDNILVKGHLQDHYAGIDLEGVALSLPSKDELSVYQPLTSQRQVMVEAVVDGTLVYDNVGRYSSSRPDLPGRDPDKGAG
jgi:hypothetical protein